VSKAYQRWRPKRCTLLRGRSTGKVRKGEARRIWGRADLRPQDELLLQPCSVEVDSPGRPGRIFVDAQEADEDETKRRALEQHRAAAPSGLYVFRLQTLLPASHRDFSRKPSELAMVMAGGARIDCRGRARKAVWRPWLVRKRTGRSVRRNERRRAAALGGRSALHFAKRDRRGFSLKRNHRQPRDSNQRGFADRQSGSSAWDRATQRDSHHGHQARPEKRRGVFPDGPQRWRGGEGFVTTGPHVGGVSMADPATLHGLAARRPGGRGAGRRRGSELRTRPS